MIRQEALVVGLQAAYDISRERLSGAVELDRVCLSGAVRLMT